MKGQSQDREMLRKLRHEAFTGIDIVDEVVRLCAMNLYLHGIGNGGSPVYQADALAKDSGEKYQVVLTNPPFGKKSSYRVVGEDGEVSSERENYEREDFKFTTSNKQFNFLQHIMTILDTHGRAGVVLPDNVLFEAGRAGEGIRKRLLEQFNFHTLLRLPTGIWYSAGVKANVLFFDKKPAAKEAWTKALPSRAAARISEQQYPDREGVRGTRAHSLSSASRNSRYPFPIFHPCRGKCSEASKAWS